MKNTTVIVKLSEDDRKKNHVPDWVFDLANDFDVFVKDYKSGELVQVLDLRNNQADTE